MTEKNEKDPVVTAIEAMWGEFSESPLEQMLNRFAMIESRLDRLEQQHAPIIIYDKEEK